MTSEPSIIEKVADTTCSTMRCNCYSAGQQVAWSRRVSQWFCAQCWKVGESYSDLVEHVVANEDFAWARLLKIPRPLQLPRGHNFKWSSLHVRALEEFTRSRIEHVWDDVLPQVLGTDPCRSMPAQLENFFATLAASRSFQQCWTGQKRRPCVLPAPLFAGLLSSKDVLHGLAMPPSASRGTCESALTLTDGYDFQCPISLPPIRTLEQFQEVLQFGTVFLNTASLHWKNAAEICLAATAAFLFPTNINVYVTGPGRIISTDVHTDNHDVVILQTEGAKHWQIFAPPPPSSSSHPLYRGKNGDKLLACELGQPLLDVILRAGEVLFVPMGFPHFTCTAGIGHSAISVHLTLGLSTADYNFCLGGLRNVLLEQAGLPPDETETSSPLWWHLLSPVPIGCLTPAWLQSPNFSRKFLNFLECQLIETTALGTRQPQLSERIQQRMSQHLTQQIEVLKLQAEAYAEVASGSDGTFYAIGPADTRSQYRRAMLVHQLAERERKCDGTSISDMQFVKRIDPRDGTAKTFAEIRQECVDRGQSTSIANHYWTSCCKSVYPEDRPPEDLVNELLAASRHCGALLEFLRRRTPHLRSDIGHVLTEPFAGHSVLRCLIFAVGAGLESMCDWTRIREARRSRDVQQRSLQRCMSGLAQIDGGKSPQDDAN